MTAVHVHEQFDDAPQQRHASMLGMWLFLATELLLFSGLFTGYTIYRAQWPDAFAQAGTHLYKWIGIGNTAILLLSSACMALAVQTAPSRNRIRWRWMLTTAILGLGFLVIKGIEYKLDYDESLVPAMRFDAAPFTDPAHSELFFVFYWIMTGLHALHVAAGISVISILAIRTRNAPHPENLDNSVAAVGLYWHFVDIVWLFLLPLLYLTA